LRTEQLDDAWRDGWEELITTRVMTAPVVVFAGLGTAAAVLVETIRRVRTAVTDHVSVHVDPDEFGSSQFTATLEIPEEHFVRSGWSDFMSDLADRVVSISWRVYVVRSPSSKSSTHSLLRTWRRYLGCSSNSTYFS